MVFRVYAADGLRAIANNTSQQVTGGVKFNKSYLELLGGFIAEKEETRTGEEIIKYMKDKLGSK